LTCKSASRILIHSVFGKPKNKKGKLFWLDKDFPEKRLVKASLWDTEKLRRKIQTIKAAMDFG
jgi:hypothetical protein